MYNIIQELNKENGTNYKIDTLKKYINNKLLQRVLKMCYDKVVYTYGVTLKNVNAPLTFTNDITLEQQLDNLELLNDRTYTGNAAIFLVQDTLHQGSKQNSEIIKGIINRDLRLNIGRTGINKVFKNLITKEPYMRCSLYNQKTIKKINFPCMLQIKADGLYQVAKVQNNQVQFVSRSGEERQFPELKKIFKTDGVYIGELLVEGITDRAEANGLINSDNPPHDKIYMQMWDYVTLDEYKRPKDKLNKTKYSERFKKLKELVPKEYLIQTEQVQNIKEALFIVSEWMKEGYEGGIFKGQKQHFYRSYIAYTVEIKTTNISRNASNRFY